MPAQALREISAQLGLNIVKRMVRSDVPIDINAVRGRIQPDNSVGAIAAHQQENRRAIRLAEIPAVDSPVRHLALGQRLTCALQQPGPPGFFEEECSGMK